MICTPSTQVMIKWMHIVATFGYVATLWLYISIVLEPRGLISHVVVPLQAYTPYTTYTPSAYTSLYTSTYTSTCVYPVYLHRRTPRIPRAPPPAYTSHTTHRRIPVYLHHRIPPRILPPVYTPYTSHRRIPVYLPLRIPRIPPTGVYLVHLNVHLRIRIPLYKPRPHTRGV